MWRFHEYYGIVSATRVRFFILFERAIIGNKVDASK